MQHCEESVTPQPGRAHDREAPPHGPLNVDGGSRARCEFGRRVRTPATAGAGGSTDICSGKEGTHPETRHGECSDGSIGFEH